jgi:hypothetical protein
MSSSALGGVAGVVQDLFVAEQQLVDLPACDVLDAWVQAAGVVEAGGAVAEFGIAQAAVAAVQPVGEDTGLAGAADQRFALSVDLDLIGLKEVRPFR